MTKMKLAWAWAKAHAALVLGSLVTLLLGFLAWGAYERKVGRLKDSIKVEQARRDVAALEAKRDVLMATEAKLADKDARLTARDGGVEVKIIEAKKQAVAARESVEGRTNEEIAARFNQLYRR